MLARRVGRLVGSLLAAAALVVLTSNVIVDRQDGFEWQVRSVQADGFDWQMPALQAVVR
ncbi:hypothetical protein [Micromonospora sp. SH-82]|uniref:hypothetical protein n=1 Tax=Micromonospora sp. SH-82 TaxID=3132938 RepID=UPI003EC0E148